MTTKLFPYEYVPAGFEIVIDLGNGNEHGYQGDIHPGSKGGIWNLWFNINYPLTDNPQAWDDEVKAINKKQTTLGNLTNDQRLIRAQMAEFCRVHALFPQSIDMLCEEIGTSRFSIPIKMGCEGRGLLETLGYEDSQILDDQRRQSLARYRQILTRWLAQSPEEDINDSRIYGFLGEPTDNKISFVEKLITTINPVESSIVDIRELCREQSIKTQGETVVNTPVRPFSCFRCNEADEKIPNCPCSYIMFIDTALICTGTFGEERRLGKKFRLYELYSFVQENILAYAAAINSWLSNTSPESIRRPQDGQYVTGVNSLQITQRIHSSLGGKDEAKEWLAACLLKTIKSNQRLPKSIELIDSYPEATSWLTKLSGK